MVNAKTYQSKLYHTRKVSDIVKLHINELPVKREYNHSPRAESYKAFRRKFKDILSKENNGVTEFKHNKPRNLYQDSIEQYRTKILENIEKQKRLKKLGKIGFDLLI